MGRGLFLLLFGFMVCTSFTFAFLSGRGVCPQAGIIRAKHKVDQDEVTFVGLLDSSLMDSIVCEQVVATCSAI